MAGVISLFVVVLVWRFFILVGESVFAATGLPPKAAEFEARSALVGAGYTASQSEYVVRNPAARRFASTLVLVGFFGPTLILALLGVSFVLPSGENLTARGITLVVLIGGLFLFDRLGLIRAIGARPARAAARRLLADDTFETWVVVGDRVIAEVLIPKDPERSEPMIATLNVPASGSWPSSRPSLVSPRSRMTLSSSYRDRETEWSPSDQRRFSTRRDGARIDVR